MPTLTSGNTVYTHPVAKVMISIPDHLLEQLDARAQANRETRSGLLRRLAEHELDLAAKDDRAEIGRLLDLATSPKGGDAAGMIREDRESH